MTELDVDAIVESAALAPSVHNTQPWRFTVDGAVVTVRVDRSRQLAYLDPSGRQLWLSCGAAVEFARLAVRASARDCLVEMLPAADDPPRRRPNRRGGRRSDDGIESAAAPRAAVAAAGTLRAVD